MAIAAEVPPNDTASKRRRWTAKRAFVLLALLGVFSVAIFLGRDALLRAAADLWIVSDAVGPADAVIVLGGGLETRPVAAAEYYRRGLTKKVLVANSSFTELETLAILPSHAAVNRSVLVKLGVPEADIEIFGTGLSNTYEEIVALREWLARTHSHSVIVPTEIFASRRVRWVVDRIFDGTKAEAQVPALTAPEYSRADWWKNERGLIAFQNEVIKYIYYRFKY